MSLARVADDRSRSSPIEQHIIHDQGRECRRDNGLLKSTRRWIPVTRPETSDSNLRVRDITAATSRQETEEFEKLPIAVRRKYFSTLERLRIAQTSTNSPDEGLDNSNNSAANRPTIPGLRRVASQKLATRAQTLPIFQTSPDQVPATGTSRAHWTGNEQAAVGRSLRTSVILDAADEAVYGVGRRLGRHTSPQNRRPTSSISRSSMEAREGHVAVVGRPETTGTIDAAFYDSCRWVEENQDLDLRLYLDNQQTTVKETPPLSYKERRPSFRRHLSMSKTPFGRSSTSTAQPWLSSALSTPTSPTPGSSTNDPFMRHKSRALSPTSSRHTAHGSTASIDPTAAHYQDPEARLKLRVYLASPQKFDEAVEFGFPSNDISTVRSKRGLNDSRTTHSHQLPSKDSSQPGTLVSDNCSSTYSEDISLPDSDSPRTPQSPAKYPLKSHHTADARRAESIDMRYAQVPAASREMTLRMTLTRPDLRACEDKVYGNQGSSLQNDAPSRPSYIGDVRQKESIERFFASLDEDISPVSSEGSVVKRFWNRVRRTN